MGDVSWSKPIHQHAAIYLAANSAACFQIACACRIAFSFCFAARNGAPL
jgi:hypothetical protein